LRILNTKILFKFLNKHRKAEDVINNWVRIVKHALWECFEDVKNDHVSVRYINEYRLVFKIGGNKWRIDTTIDYQGNLLFINRVGTHEEYNKWKY